ncbi:MAG: DNA polymerase III subunit alpha [Bacilli bacterium]|nr:DNA polymerase III subunit alpha [Bacilli bacterium]
MDFINLYVQTEYSILSSGIKLEDYFAYAKESGLSTISICDNDLYGAYKFYQGCIKNGIKPIVGMSLNLATNQIDKVNNILLYAYNYEGYINLCRLASIKHLSGLGEDVYATLAKHAKGLVAILPGRESAILREYSKTSPNTSLVDNLLFLKDIFDYFYVGLMAQTSLDKEDFGGLYVTCRSANIKMVALHKTNYFNKEDFEVYKTLKLISLISANTKEYMATQREENSYYATAEVANYMFMNYPDLLEASCEIASICNLEIEAKGYHFPKFVIEDNSFSNSKEYLDALAKIGLNKRLKNKSLSSYQIEEYKNRLLYELDIINKMGFSDYFLIVYDYVKYAKMNNILVGPGRGSAAGSLVSYVLGITNIDPIEYKLLFERFLNPERITMPDIDVDFPDSERGKIYAHLIAKYGEDKVAHIGTFGTFKPRSAIRDVAKVLGIKDETVRIINNSIPEINSPSLNTISTGDVNIKRMIASDDTIRQLFYLASKIENMPRNTSVHASGVVIGDNDLFNYSPLARSTDGVLQTEYEASDIEDIGLVKMDILSLSTLNSIQKILIQIKEKQGINIDINKIKLDDPNVFKLMASGDTDGIFQFEGSGIRKLLRDLKVSSLEDMIIANAMYRPGPMEMIDTLIKRRGGQKYRGIDPSIDDILAPTYGIIVFQEQILLIAQKYAGFSLGQADLLRRAVSKKKGEEMLKMREAFLRGAYQKGHALDDANKIYDYIEKFANYGFNRSHSVVYSVIAYQMAYFKTYYYPYFMSVLMEASLGDKEKLVNYLSALKARRYVIMPPDINISSLNFEARDNYIYYPLQGVKNISSGIANEIIKIRSVSPFSSYEDFITRTKDSLSKKMVESLINSGAFDSFNITRMQATKEYDNALRRASFSGFDDRIIKEDYAYEEYDFATISKKELEALGINIKYDEFIQYKELEKKFNTAKLVDLQFGKNLVIAKVNYIHEYNSKNGLMAFINIADSSTSLDVTVFSDEYKRYRSELIVSKVYLLEIMVNKKEDSLRYHLTNLRKL